MDFLVFWCCSFLDVGIFCSIWGRWDCELVFGVGGEVVFERG